MSPPALAIAAAMTASFQQHDKAVFRISTEAILVDVFVERDGRAVTGLGPDDFEIYDDGEARRVDGVAVEELPLNVVLALDTSLSVAGPTLRHLQDAAASFLSRLSRDDRAGLVTFSHHVSLRSGLTSELDSLDRAMQDVEPLGGTAWHDALFSCLEILEPVRERPVVVLFTDGADTYSWLGDDQVLSLVRQSNAVIYAVTRRESVEMANLHTSQGQRERRDNLREYHRRTGLLRAVTEESGGRFIETSSSERLRDIFLEIVAEMKTRYVLTYTSPGTPNPGWHRLDVKVKRRGVDVHARRGYFYRLRD